MILALSTADPITELYLIDDGKIIARKKWSAERQLARNLLGEIESVISKHDGWDRLSGLVVFVGPGSFTGLRIGITTMNALAYGLNAPIVGAKESSWIDAGLTRLKNNENDKIVLPEYGSAPNITKPKK